MNAWLFSFVISLSLAALNQAQLDPSVCTPLPYKPGTVGGNAGGAACVFPFIYGGVSRDDCITVDHKDGLPWCSTTSNYDQDKKWGECPATTDGTGKGHRCVFPFIYNGKAYNKCIPFGHDKPWCATTGNYDKDKKWGNCPAYTEHELPSLPDKFSAKIQWKMLSDKMDMFLEEFFDRTDNIGSVRATGWAKPGQRSLFLSNYDTDEFFQITDLDLPFPDLFNCEVSALDKNLPFVAPFTRNNDSLSDTMISGVAALKFGLDFPTVYMGKTELDGVYVEQWDACVYSKARNNATLLINYFFTDKDNWTSSSGLTQVPYEIRISGKDNLGVTHHSYQYSHFTNVIRDEEVFLSPPYTLCQGRRKTKRQPPTFPSQFSFSSEVLYNELSLVTQSDEWYDNDNKFFRYDYTPFPQWGMPTDDPPNKIKCVDDYNTGISYIIDTVIGNCTVTTLPVNEMAGFQLSPNVSRMRSPDEFFDLDKYPVYYKGDRTVRGLLTNVFITTHPYPNEYEQQKVAVYEWHFLDNLFSTQAPGKIEHQVPVKLSYSIPDLSTSQVQSFFNFVEQEPNMGIFDVSECFRGSEKRHFSLILNGTYVGNVDRNLVYFRQFVLAAIKESTKVSQIRVSNIEFDYDPKSVYLRFTILGPIKNVVGGVKTPLAQVPLEEAARALEQDINNGKFSVMMTINFEDDTKYLKAVPFSLKERIRYANGTIIEERFKPSAAPPTQPLVPPTIRPTPTTKPNKVTTMMVPTISTNAPPPPSRQTIVVCPTNDAEGNSQTGPAPSGLSTGAIAGIGAGSGFAGIILGALVTYVIYATSMKRKYDLDKSVLTMNEITNHTYS